MKSKGQVYVVAFMLAVVIILLALSFAFPVHEMVTLARNETSEIGGMNCTSTTDDYVKAGCLVADISQSYFIGGLMAIAGMVIAARIIWGGSQ